ncbi:sugar-binding protein [Embleya sp. NPDC059259]|uniref:sugar-binding protein n=2 Tax=Embleya TaxID=2699295 RepID=UPI00368D2512
MTTSRAHRPSRRPRRVRAALLAAATALGVGAALSGAVVLADGTPPIEERAHHDVLFVGAHPDDEYQSLAAFGQWNEDDHVSVGVATITRGEGGGNAAGPEEGAALGLVRETEERRAVEIADVRNVFHLDKPDFWYTLSAPLTARVWDGPPRLPDTLERLVRLIRATTPTTVVTMDPRPFDQHGGHQLAGRLTIEAFRLAGDPAAFPTQVTHERYRPWQPTRLLTQNWGFRGPTGPGCAGADVRDPATGLHQLGVWEGTLSRRHGTTWAQQERNAQRVYRTQGFASIPAEVDTPRHRLGCDWFSVLAENGEPLPAPVEQQGELLPLYDDFRAWATRVGLPWLANRAQPAYPLPPTTTVPTTARPPAVDGVATPAEYPGEPLTLTHWQGEVCASPADCSTVARFSRHADDLHVAVEVTDDAQGAALPTADCKRHWRTDSVEIAVDPRGDADDTSTTFKAAILPFTAEGPACAARDADQHQGPAADTAPGLHWAAGTHPRGYTVEVRIPLSALPGTVNPAALRANVLVYDSDTPDRTGRARLAWSTFGSAQADPHTWGHTPLDGPVLGPSGPSEAVIPLKATDSADSPAAVEQSHRTGIPLAVGPSGRR